MAATAAARRLTEQHRLAQNRVGVATLTAIRAAWRLLDPEDIDGTVDRWVAAVLPIIQSQRATSARLAANYLTAFRALEVGTSATAPAVLAEPVAAEAVATSMLVTGPHSLRANLSRGMIMSQALTVAEASSAGAAIRHTLNGGRDTIIQTVERDRDALGWARATSGDPCSFCAMLASRGPAYRGEDSAGFQAHDSCSCVPEPVYRRDAAWPAGTDRFAEQWQEARDRAAEEGVDVSVMFRRIHESRA